MRMTARDRARAQARIKGKGKTQFPFQQKTRGKGEGEGTRVSQRASAIVADAWTHLLVYPLTVPSGPAPVYPFTVRKLTDGLYVDF